MKAVVSFTALVFAFMRDLVTIEQLREIDLFVFSCTKDHALTNLGVPSEVAPAVWYYNERRVEGRDDLIDPGCLSVGAQEDWRRLRALLQEKENVGSVWWKGDPRRKGLFYHVEVLNCLQDMGYEVVSFRKEET